MFMFLSLTFPVVFVIEGSVVLSGPQAVKDVIIILAIIIATGYNVKMYHIHLL